MRHSPPPPPPPHRERVFLNERGVLVTTTRLVVPSQTFAMSGITSIRGWTEPPDRGTGCVLFFSAALFALLAVVIVLARLDDPAGATVHMVAAILFLVAGAMAVLGTYLFKLARPVYWLLVRTAGGEVRAMRHEDRDWVGRVGQAVTEAIIARG